MASTWAAMASRALRVKPAGSFSRSSAMSSKATPIGRYISGSWADVWSVTTSISAPLRSSSGTTSAALPSTPMLSGLRWSRASYARRSASSRSAARTSR